MLLLLPSALATPCDAWADAVVLTTVDVAPVSESSGLAASRGRPGTWFTHDDSGGAAEIYAFDLGGAYRGSHEVSGAVPLDWEDMAAGPCPGLEGDCLYIGDIGDNVEARTFVTVYVVAEPAEGVDAPVLYAWNLAYEDGPTDAEALLVHPLTAEVYVVSKKSSGESGVYRMAAVPSDGEVGTLERVATLDLSSGNRQATGADWSPDGARVAVRTYTTAWVWEADPCDPDAAWDGLPIRMATPAEAQGEAIAFDLDGALVTTSEGAPLQVSRMECIESGEEPGPCGPNTGEALDEGCCSGRASLVLFPPVLLAVAGRRRGGRSLTERGSAARAPIAP